MCWAEFFIDSNFTQKAYSRINLKILKDYHLSVKRKTFWKEKFYFVNLNVGLAYSILVGT